MAPGPLLAPHPWRAGLLRAYVHHFHRRHRFVGPLWQGRFKSPAVQAEGYWVSCGRYIERNPVAARLVDLPWEYRWSSAAFYALGAADPLVDENPWYQELSPAPRRRQPLWRAFLLGPDEREEEIRAADWVAADAGFVGRVGQERGRPIRSRRGRPPKQPTARARISMQGNE